MRCEFFPPSGIQTETEQNLDSLLRIAKLLDSGLAPTPRRPKRYRDHWFRNPSLNLSNRTREAKDLRGQQRRLKRLCFCDNFGPDHARCHLEGPSGHAEGPYHPEGPADTSQVIQASSVPVLGALKASHL